MAGSFLFAAPILAEWLIAIPGRVQTSSLAAADNDNANAHGMGCSQTGPAMPALMLVALAGFWRRRRRLAPNP